MIGKNKRDNIIICNEIFMKWISRTIYRDRMDSKIAARLAGRFDMKYMFLFENTFE